jgi:hypothetical protein
MKWKKDCNTFKEVLDGLKEGSIRSGLGPRRRWVAKYIYHFTDLNNAVPILNDGVIYSREAAEANSLMVTDNASKGVMGQTNSDWKSFVRFYFRPKTPTQYRNEGVRSEESLTYDAHCPVPVFFLFNSEKMLCREDSLFSYGSLATDTDDVYHTAEKYKEMPFRHIYHEGAYDPDAESYIKFHRHAELIVPNQCSLADLELIVCRSAAEKETLLNLVDFKVKNQLKNKFKIDSRNKLFFGSWTYIENVNLSKEQVIFTIHKRPNDRFKTYAELTEVETNKIYTLERESHEVGSTLKINLKRIKNPENYIVKLFLDDNLVYKGHYVDDNWLPF